MQSVEDSEEKQHVCQRLGEPSQHPIGVGVEIEAERCADAKERERRHEYPDPGRRDVPYELVENDREKGEGEQIEVGRLAEDRFLQGSEVPQSRLVVVDVLSAAEKAGPVAQKGALKHHAAVALIG